MHIKNHSRSIKQSLFGLGLFVIVSVILGAGNLPTAHAQGMATPEPNKYYTIEMIRLSNGTSLEEIIINGPPVPPPGFEIERQTVSLPAHDSVGTGILTVPAYSWVYGCSAVSGAMIAGYYDQNGWPDMYTGPTNGGVMPMDNSSWPTWSDGSVIYPNNPLVASKNGLDSRTSRGSIDDYWVSYDSAANDPYITNGWAQHAWGDAIGDYMKTSQSAYSNTDGSTAFYTYTSSANQLTCAAMLSGGISTRDGTYGRKLFYEARGYTVTDCYNQKTDNTIAGGFSFTQFKAEIDAGRPVMLNLAGHTVVGVGYDDSASTVYIHDTWDSLNHTMIWGGSYAGMSLLSVSIVNLQETTTPIHTISGNVGVDGATLSYTDGTSKTATADGSGSYSFMVSSGWNGAVTPTKTGYVFVPTSKNYTDVQENLNGQDYVAEPVFTISGNAGVAGATLSYLEDGISKTVTTNSAGAYSIAISAGWSGTVTPYKLGVSFDPASRTYTDVQANLSNSNYTANLMVMTAADSGSGSLRQVLADTPSGGMVKFDPSLAGQTITLVSTITISKNITLDGGGLNPRVEISGGDAVRIFLVDTPSSTPMSVNIKNLVLKNGRQTGLSYTYYGGAIFVDGYANLTLENALIKNNSAYYAGAIYISSSGKVTATNSEIINNEADQSGGAIYVNSTGTLDIRKSKIAGNISNSGGAIYFSGATNTSFIEHNLFENNSALSGGAILGQLGNARIEIRGNLFTGNQATNTYGAGGAVYFSASTIPTLIVMENNTFYNNISKSSGGAAYFGMGPTVYLINNTFSYNMATTGGNLYLAAGASVSRMYNNIIANSAGGGDCYAFYNSYTYGSNNLVEDGTAMCLPSLTGDPELLPLADNGGPTQTMALAPDSSPAIDTGTNFRCTIEDQRGIARPQGAYCDIGAYEYVDLLAPDTQIDSKPANPNNSTEATFTFSSADATASFECLLDDGAFTACASPKSYTGLAVGLHTFVVRAQDSAGNTDATPASYTWTIDLTAPDTQIYSKPADPSNSPAATFTFSSADATASFECSLDGSAFTACASPKNYTDLADGLHTFVVRAKDPAGNTDATPASYTWTIHTTAGIRYAKPAASGTEDCSSWANACTLQTALTGAISGDEIWVAAGAHKPTTGTDRAATFQLKDGVAVYGGFTTTETVRDQRDFDANETILSGDLLGNDTDNVAHDEPTRAENSYHVVVGSSTDNSAVLDGFTVTGGNANDDYGVPCNLGCGGGMYNFSGSPTLRNVVFKANATTYDGGGIYNWSSSPALTNVTFSNNSAGNQGGGIFNVNNSNPTLTKVDIIANTAYEGGGMLSYLSSPTLTNMVFSGNTASLDGGGMWNGEGNPTLTNVTFNGNSASSYGGGMFNAYGSPALLNVTFSANSAGSQGGGMYNFESNPTLTNVTITGSSGGGLYGDTSSPTLKNVIIANTLDGGDCGPENEPEEESSLNAASSHNLIEDEFNACGLLDGVNGNIIGSDPLLGALADNGGLTQTHALLPDSPALDKGTNSGCPTADQRGVTRPQGAACDIGAFEYVDTTSPTVDTFTVSSLSASLNIPITAFAVSDNVEVGGYLITSSSTPPAVGDVGWSISAPTSFTVASDGIYDLYPWAKDASGNISSVFGSPASVTVDTTSPAVTMTSAASNPTNASPILVTIQFSETVTGFTATDIVPGNGTLSNFTALDGDTYTFDLIPTANGSVTADIAAGVATDLAGNANIIATQFSRSYDTIAPAVSSSIRASASPTNLASVDFTVSFSESVTGVDVTDFTLTTSGVSGAAVSGVSGSGSVYMVSVNTGTGDGTIRLNVVNDNSIMDATLNPLAIGFTGGETYQVSKAVTAATFKDVPLTYWASSFVERLYSAGITGGCATTPDMLYCPETSVTRAQMAVFLLKSMHGPTFNPPLVGDNTGFGDVATSHWAAAWIKQLAAEGITGGCGAGIYCPESPVTRAQMAVFLLKAKNGSGYIPPLIGDGSGFTDVPNTYWAAVWIKQLAADGITGGCGAGVYCPESPVTRAQMAVFLVRAFNLP